MNRTNPFRLVKQGALHVVSQLRGDVQERAADVIRRATHGFTPQHLAFLVEQDVVVWDLVPAQLGDAMTLFMLANADLKLLDDHEIHLAALEARPDCRELLSSPAGRRWLTRMVNWEG